MTRVQQMLPSYIQVVIFNQNQTILQVSLELLPKIKCKVKNIKLQVKIKVKNNIAGAKNAHI